MNKSIFSNKNVLVTGGCGTIGKELVKQLLEEFTVKGLVVLDNNESDLFFLEQRYMQHTNASFFLADIRDPTKLSRKMKEIDIVFHTAAFKHVILCDRSPFEAVQTNIIGVQNVISACSANGAKRVLFTSSDKAVNPTSVMGTSKLMGERLMTAANSNARRDQTIFTSTRFGNVLGSRGSVIPIFREQIRRGGPVTLTDPNMTRFIMSIKEAVRLVIESALIARGGEVFITKMPVIRIQDLAEVMIDELASGYGYSPGDIKIQIIGTKPGEKMYEELMNDEETRRAYELERYFVIKPAHTCLYRDIEYNYSNVVSQKVSNPYHSANCVPLSKAEIARFLKENDLFVEDSEDNRHPAERFWA